MEASIGKLHRPRSSPSRAWILPFFLGTLIPLAFSSGHYYGRTRTAPPVAALAERCGVVPGQRMLLGEIGPDEKPEDVCPPGYLTLRVLELRYGRYAIFVPDPALVGGADSRALGDREEDLGEVGSAIR